MLIARDADRGDVDRSVSFMPGSTPWAWLDQWCVTQVH